MPLRDRQTSRWVLRPDCAPVRNVPELGSQHDATPPVQLQYPGELRAIAGIAIGANFNMYFLRQFYWNRVQFLANVNWLYAIARPSVCLSVCRLSVVCNAHAPYSGGSNFLQYFYGICYPSHPLTSTENFTEIVPGEPLRRGS